MGTKVESKSCLPGYYSMRDPNDDSNSCSWPLYYGDKTSTNGQYYNGFFLRATADAYPGHDMDALKRKMLEHEAIFRNQVSELHRLYRIQKDLMDEIKKKQLPKNQVPIGPSLSSIEDAHKWHIPSFPVANSNCARPLVSGVEHSHSPLSFTKGSSIQAGSFLSQNGDNSNDVEVIECRPTKVRRKTFDLELPADEYIDTEEAEQFKDETAPGMSRYLPRGNGKFEKLFLGDTGKIGCSGDTSDTCLRGKNSLADLNEPIQIEESDGSAYSDCQDPNYGGCELSGKPKQELLGLSKEISINSRGQRDNWSINNVHVESNGNARGFLPHVLEAGHCTANLISTTQGFQSEKLPVSSQQVQVLFDKAQDPPTFSLTDQSKAELSRERMLHSLEVPQRNCEISNKSHPDSFMTFNIHGLNPFASYDVGKQWSHHSVSSWEKPSSNLSQKSMSVQTPPFLNSSGSFSKSSMMAPECNGIFGEKWQVSCNSKRSPGFGGELPNRNGCCHGSSSGSKEPAIYFPSIGYDYPKCSNDSKGVFDHFTSHGSTKLYNCSNSVNTNSRTDMNLNVMLSNGSSTEPVVQQGHQKQADRLPGLPWLRAKPACKNEATSEGRDLNVGELSFSQSCTKQLTVKNEIRNGFNQILMPDVKSVPFFNNGNTSRSDISECLHNKTILGTPIFEKCYVSKNESCFTSPFVSVPKPSKAETENKGRNRLLDINLPCDATNLDMGQDNVAENEADGQLSSFRSQIDLNSCVDENEASFTPSVPSIGLKTAGGIDLEAPPAPEPEDVTHGEELLEKACELPLGSVQGKDDCLQDEVIKSAAEAIVVISSSGLCSHSDDFNRNSSEPCEIDTLNWFVETISSFGEDLESKLEALSRDQDESSVEEIDYFESMILELAETKEEDFMPKPLVPENLKVEETGSSGLLTSRTRKGQGRRGRQRRDFRRDILPGLVSLSRHEVTEDLQTFGWLMRATGHSWQSGLTRRNGCGTGRRRRLPATTNSSPASTSTLVQQLNNIKVGSEDRRSLTGWGKTTRRPRRQRCPSGNPPPLAIT